MTERPMTDPELRKILTQAKSFACVGVSANPVRPSYFVARFLSLRGYRVIPVNPVLSGQELFGVPAASEVTDVSEPIDIVDIFRRSEAVPEIVAQALALPVRPKVIWMQIGVRHAEAAATAEAAGITVVQDRCPKIEYQRLFGELRRAGINTGVISSKL